MAKRHLHFFFLVNYLFKSLVHLFYGVVGYFLFYVFPRDAIEKL